ncbi:hypothetical protein B0H13DRAFT_2228821 [Mycena leptocephala]|nr:hypothetical protein B0H13DRAFT_2228821 [Mycena leptocephala]
MTAQPADSIPESLGERMKRYEAVTDQYLPDDQPAIIRIDGHGFSKFTRGFEKPFDHPGRSTAASGSLPASPRGSLRAVQPPPRKAADVPERKLGTAHFDGRVFSVPNVAELLNNLIWRAKMDCRRNSISAFGAQEQYEFTATDGLTGKEVTSTRTRMWSEDIPWWEFNDHNLALVIAKYWDVDSAAYR